MSRLTPYHRNFYVSFTQKYVLPFSHRTSFNNNEDANNIGQGVLRGSSLAAPIYILNSDVSLSTHNKLACGAAFTHPITGDTIHDKAIQYVDDTSQILNPKGTYSENTFSPDMCSSLLQHAQLNSNAWKEIMWISGGI
jgi:hypothetical protein